MLGLSQTTGYAILALSCLEADQDRLVHARQIAECTGIPLPYLSKILHALGIAGLVKTKRGYKGGFALSRPADQVSLLDIAKATEGDDCVPRCLLGLSDCSDERACPMHRFWKQERGRIETELLRMTLCEVAAFERRRGRPCVEGCECETDRAGGRGGAMGDASARPDAGHRRTNPSEARSS